MKIDLSETWLPVYKALDSEVRLKIIRMLALGPMNIKEIAEATGLSSAIITMHIRKLETAGIVEAERIRGNGAMQKLCRLATKTIEIEFPSQNPEAYRVREFSLPVGHYSDFSVKPTCGLATDEKIIGFFDDPRYFLDPERMNCKILWFSAGFVEYKIPNYMFKGQEIKVLELSMELGSEAPGVNSDWPSDIGFSFNGTHIGQWTSPGDFGDERGAYTPKWWNLRLGQYGFLKIIRIDDTGTYIDGSKVSDVTLEQLDLAQKQWNLKIEVSEDAEHCGGVTIFGAGFGNYDQDILLRLYYS